MQQHITNLESTGNQPSKGLEHPLVDELIDTGGYELRLHDQADFCRYLLKSPSGITTERKIRLPELALKTLRYLSDKPVQSQAGSFYVNTIGAEQPIEVSYFYSDSDCCLTLRNPASRLWPDTLEQTTLNSASIETMRHALQEQIGGTTLISCNDSFQANEIYNTCLHEMNVPTRNIVSLQQAPFPVISRITQADPRQYQAAGKNITTALKAADTLFYNGTGDPLERRVWHADKCQFQFQHARSSGAAIRLLMNAGISEHLLCASLYHIVDIKTAGLVCPHCADSYQPGASELNWIKSQAPELLDDSSIIWLESGGCVRCNHTGHESHVSLAEAASFNDAMELAINRQSLFAFDREVAASLSSESIDNQARTYLRQGKLTYKAYRVLFPG